MVDGRHRGSAIGGRCSAWTEGLRGDDHSDEARRVGLALRDTKLFIVGSPSVSTPVIEAAPLAALDVPLRVVIWEDGYQTKVSYPSPAESARRYGLDADLTAALKAIEAWTSTVVDR